jgi:hypothetical protein
MSHDLYPFDLGTMNGRLQSFTVSIERQRVLKDPIASHEHLGMDELPNRAYCLNIDGILYTPLDHCRPMMISHAGRKLCWRPVGDGDKFGEDGVVAGSFLKVSEAGESFRKRAKIPGGLFDASWLTI